jgi:hypothetical protein
MRNDSAEYLHAHTLKQGFCRRFPSVLYSQYLSTATLCEWNREADSLMTLTIMSDGEEPITARSKRTIIPSSRLLDSNNSATPQLTSHRQALNPTTPSTNLRDAKRNIDDADWNSSLSNEEWDLDDSDSAKKTVYSGVCSKLVSLGSLFNFTAKHLRCTRSSASDLGTHTGKYTNHLAFIDILMRWCTNLYRHPPRALNR